MRPDGRRNDELRPLAFERDFTEMAHGSCLVSFGRTRVLCTASIEEEVGVFIVGDAGWKYQSTGDWTDDLDGAAANAENIICF